MEFLHLFSQRTVSFDLKLRSVSNGVEAKMADTADVMTVGAEYLIIEVIQKTKTIRVILE